MDERSPRQPDSSGPPEESGDTPTRGVRPENPYRIPQRPPAAGGAAASGASDRPESWDTPYPAAQGPTGEWASPRPDETPPTDTWRDWETPEKPAEEPGSGWFSTDKQSADPDPADTPGSHRRGAEQTTAAWDEQPGDARGSGDAWGGNDQGDTWDSANSGPQPTSAAWSDQPGDTPQGTSAGSRRGAHGEPPQTGTSWGSTPGSGDDAPAWGEQTGGTRGSSDTWNSTDSGPQPTSTTWSDQPGGAHSERTTAAWGTPDDTDDAPTWGDQPGGTRGSGDTWGGSDQGGSWDSANSGPQPTSAAWSDQQGSTPPNVDAPGTRGTHGDPQQPATWDTPGSGDDAPAWGAHSGPQQSATAWGSSGDADNAPAWGGSGQGDSWDTTNSGPQPTSAAWSGDPEQTTAAWNDSGQDDAPAWGEQTGGAHRGSGSDAGGTAWGGDAPEQTTAAWGDADDVPTRGAHSGPRQGTPGSGDAASAWGAQPSDTRGSGDTWGNSDQGDTWDSTNSGPQPTSAAWGGDPEQATAAWSESGQDDAPAWGDQPRGARGTGDTWGDSGQGDSWGEQTGATWGDSGDEPARGAHSGPQPTGAAWGTPGDDAPAWGDQPRDGRGAGDTWGGRPGETQQGDAPMWGDQSRDGRGAGDSWDDTDSGPQQAGGAWSAAGQDEAPMWGDRPPAAGGRGGPPPQGPGGPRDDWDDWDGEPQDEPRREGFEYLYNGNTAVPEPERPEPPARKSRRGLLIGGIAAVVVLALIGGGVSWYVLNLPQADEATTAYAAAWEAQDYEAMAAVTTGGDPAEVLGGIATGIGVENVDVTVGEPTTDGDTGTATYEVSVGLSNAGDWGWEGELPLVRQDGEWLVEFSPEVAFPGLTEGQTLARTAVWGERGQIHAADGTRLDDPSITGSLQMLVGTMGEATEEDVERLGPAYRVGDTVGATGLQRTYEERLAGQAATTIVMVDSGTEADAVEATEENTVASLDGAPGENVVTSIDMAVQNAAASAIINAPEESGMVAIRPSTGEILAAVNVPGGFNRAFEGRYPPGSTFKVITYNALLDGGMTLDSPFDCPKEYNPGGWEFTNAGGAEYGAQSMTQAFATSCNTALVRASVDNIDGNALLASAELFGMNAPLDIGVPTFEPVYPLSEGAVMLGAQAIGQGQVETSPLHMATVPAAVADGNWRPPLLVTEPAAGDLPEPRPIPNAEALRTMMRAVITEGTAKDLPFQGEVYGKTGTAEFGTAEEGEELPSHAWMVGFKGDVAFAVVVEGGGGGSSVAGPIAAKFTNAL
ncbi:penicillin-binding transpeptidase domain-containing protein [Nocardiopsis protaetiae]|uniref:penicillin-binding transpeptidase domain-containing protein n=1 Tax=Nocardiopsis protaetiae TaxID=3382270 RepID=UPI00387B4EF7